MPLWYAFLRLEAWFNYSSIPFLLQQPCKFFSHWLIIYPREYRLQTQSQPGGCRTIRVRKYLQLGTVQGDWKILSFFMNSFLYMVAVKFWACSKQLHKGRRGGRSLTGRSKEAGWRHTHRRGRRMDAQWSAIGRPVRNANIVYQFERHVCLPCTTIVPPLADQWRPLSDHCGDHCASIQRPRQHLSHHGNGSAFTLPCLYELLCHHSSFGRSRKAQGSCCSSYTETELSGFRRPLSLLTVCMVAQRWHEGRSPV